MYDREVPHQISKGAAVDIMTSQLIFSLYYRSLLPQISNGSAKVCEVYCGDG